MVRTGLREFIADWKTMAISRHRKARSSRGSRARTSLPWKRMLPAVISAGGFSSRITALAMVDLPQPDSPARPKTSPAPMEKETSSAPTTVRPSLRYSTRRPFTSSTGSMAQPLLSRRARRLRSLGLVISSTA